MQILFFSAEYCSNCPSAKKLIKENNLDVVSFDADKNLDEFKNYIVRSVPTILVLDHNGQEIKRLAGKITQAQIDQLKELQE